MQITNSDNAKFSASPTRRGGKGFSLKGILKKGDKYESSRPSSQGTAASLPDRSRGRQDTKADSPEIRQRSRSERRDSGFLSPHSAQQRGSGTWSSRSQSPASQRGGLRTLDKQLGLAESELGKFPEESLHRDSKARTQMQVALTKLETDKSQYNHHTYDSNLGHVTKTRSATPSPVRNEIRTLKRRINDIDADVAMQNFWKGMVNQLKTARNTLIGKKEEFKNSENTFMAPRSDEQVVISSTNPDLSPGDPFVKSSSAQRRYY